MHIYIYTFDGVDVDATSLLLWICARYTSKPVEVNVSVWFILCEDHANGFLHLGIAVNINIGVRSMDVDSGRLTLSNNIRTLKLERLPMHFGAQSVGDLLAVLTIELNISVAL